jgi:hypothetical protein
MPDNEYYFADKPVAILASEINAKLLMSAQQTTWDQLQQILDGVIRRRFRANRAYCQAAEAGDALKEAILLVTEELERWAQNYSAIRWLWMLRRLPKIVFQGKLPTTEAYDLMLAEVISARSRNLQQVAVVNDANFDSPRTISYSLVGAVVTRLVRFCAGVRYLANLHQLYRWAGKGADFKFERGSVPLHSEGPDLRTAINIYDQRVAARGLPLLRLGTPIVTTDIAEGTEAILWINRISPTDIQVPYPGVHVSEAVKEGKIGKTRARYLPKFYSVHSFERLLNDSRMDASKLVTPEIASLFYLLTCAIALINRHHFGFGSIANTGYMIFDRGRCFRILRDCYDSIPAIAQRLLSIARISSADEIIDILTRIKGQDWPLGSGPVFRHEEPMICVDLASAAKSLQSLLEFPPIQGEMANARAEHFENAVQAVIDASHWKPEEKLRLMRQRNLKSNNKAITEIDAIGEHEGILLLVSCKSHIYSGAYDVGEYAFVRNAAWRVLEAIDEWGEKVKRFRAQPAGDNYDFSPYHTIIGVVATPHVIFVDAEVANRYSSDGLRSCVSLSELTIWLGVETGFS